jgi:hypothetical protein
MDYPPADLGMVGPCPSFLVRQQDLVVYDSDDNRTFPATGSPATGYGSRSFTPSYDRLLRPLLAADQPLAPLPVRKALHTIDIHISERIDQARLLPKIA